MKIHKASTLEQMEDIAGELANMLSPGDVVGISGTLGAGKTTLVQFICRRLGILEYVNSPTFTLVNEYESGMIKVNHIDFYRVNHIDELIEIGIEQYFNNRDITFIEWPELFMEILPEKHMMIRIGVSGDVREVTIDA